MTRAPWTSAEQRTWLEARKPAWVAAQENQTMKTYRSKLLAEWYTKFPLGALTPKEVQAAGGDLQKAERARKETSDKVFRAHSLTMIEADFREAGVSVVSQ
jgi:hypothetical protein